MANGWRRLADRLAGFATAERRRALPTMRLENV
jgi:hypothetical protein